MIRIGFAICLVILWSSAAAAQDPPASPPAAFSLEFGPLSIRPRLDIREVGVDDNIFNAPENPQSDFTATISPRVAVELRLGWARLLYGSVVDFVYFKDFEEERSVNRSTEARFEVGRGLLRPFVHGSVLDTHDRLNAEIDARAGRRQTAYGGGLDIVLTSRTTITTAARRSSLDFDEDARYRGTELSRSLDGDSDHYEGGLRMALTPLTSWTFTAGVQHDRFEREPLRDSDSVRFMTGLQFSPSALIVGTATAGYRHFDPRSDVLAEYNGVVAQVGLTYTVDSTQLQGAVERDVRYSFEDLEPYYVTTNLRFAATQRIAGPFDVQGTIGRTIMDYRQVGGSADISRTDRATIYGGGFGYRLGATARVGVNVEWMRRRSDDREARHFDRRRVFATLSYGL